MGIYIFSIFADSPQLERQCIPMQEEVEFILDHCKEKMASAIEHLEKELVHIRAGKANPAMLDGVLVEYYGSQMPLNQVSNISTPDARTIAIQPWEKKLIRKLKRQLLMQIWG